MLLKSAPSGAHARNRSGFGAWLLTLTSVSIVDRLVLWPRPAHDLRMKSRVHPKYKTTYRVGNWREYERALVQRGDVTLWLSADATDAWRPSPSGRPGGQKRFSDVAIETALILRLVFGLPLRQTEGFVRSVLALMGADLDAPDHTTLSRRSQPLAVMLRRIPALGPIHLIVDSTGLSIVGQGAWAAAKHGGHGKRGWKKLHLGVDRSGVIVAQALTDAHVDDATTAVNLIPAVDGDISSVTADAAYDTIAVYEAAGARGARVVVPPKRTAAVSRRRPRSVARDRTVKRMQEIGQRRWKKEAGYHRQARVENVFFRYKSIIGDGLRARSSAGQGTEAVLACNVLNRMTDLGRPASYDQAVTNSWVGIVAGHVRFMQQGRPEQTWGSCSAPLGLPRLQGFFRRLGPSPELTRSGSRCCSLCGGWPRPLSPCDKHLISPAPDVRSRCA